MRLRWTPLSLRDLRNIREYIARDNPLASARIAFRIVESAEGLIDFPLRGRIGRTAGSREVVVPRTPYIVIYRVVDLEVHIVRVLHGAQRWPAR